MTRARDNSFNPSNNQVAGKNMVINGAFDYWQRGTSFTTGAFQYSADRWRIGRGAFQTGGTYTRQNADLEGFRYCIRVQRDATGNGTGGGFLATSFETSESIRFSGKIVTLSFYARKSSSYTGSGVSVVLQNGTGIDQVEFAESNFATGPNNIVSTLASSLTTSWQRFSYTALVPSNSTQLGIRFIVEYSGVAPANDYVDITGVQLELGPTATQFSRAGGTIGGELTLCQRYYYKSSELQYAPGTATYTGVVRAGVNSAGTRWLGSFILPVTMRSVPSASVYNPVTGASGSMRNEDAGTNLSASIFGMYTNTITQIDLAATTANHAVLGYIVASAEL